MKLARLMAAGGAAEAAGKLLEVVNDDDTSECRASRLEGNHPAEEQRIPPERSVKRSALLKSIRATIDAVGILAAKKVAEGDLDGALKLLNSLHAQSAKRNPDIAAEDSNLRGQEGFHASRSAAQAGHRSQSGRGGLSDATDLSSSSRNDGSMRRRRS